MNYDLVVFVFLPLLTLISFEHCWLWSIFELIANHQKNWLLKIFFWKSIPKHSTNFFLTFFWSKLFLKGEWLLIGQKKSLQEWNICFWLQQLQLSQFWHKTILKLEMTSLESKHLFCFFVWISCIFRLFQSNLIKTKLILWFVQLI